MQNDNIRIGTIGPGQNSRSAFEARLLSMYNDGEISPEDYIVRKKRLRDMLDEEERENRLRYQGINSPASQFTGAVARR